MTRLLRTWLARLLLFIGAFAAGYVAFHPAWRKVPALTDGSSLSFKHTAERIEKEDLLGKASPQERVRWLLEICQQPALLGRNHALHAAIHRMQPGDFLSAIADLPELARRIEAMDDETRTMLLEASLERWLDVDPTGALRSLAFIRGVVESETIPLPTIGQSDLATTYRVLAARKPDWLREQISKLGSDMEPDLAMGALILQETKRDPRKAREWLETLRGGKNWVTIRKDYVMTLAESDPRAAMEFVVSEGSERDLIDRLFENLAGRSPALAAELLSKLDPERSRQIGWTATSLIEQGGGDPFSWFADRLAMDPAGPDVVSFSEKKAEAVMRGLVARDPVRALDLITLLPESQQSLLRDGALSIWSRQHPAAFMEWLATQAPDAAPASASSLKAAASWVPELFAKWLEALPAGDLRDRSQLILASQLAYKGRTLEALQRFPRTSSVATFPKSARTLAAQLASQDPAEVARWVEGLPTGPAQTHAAAGLVQEWTNREPRAAAQWIESLPAGQLRDAGTTALAVKMVQADPDASAAWVESIRDPAAKERAVNEVFRSWAINDPSGARDWLREMPGLSEVMKNRLINRRK